MAKCTLDLDQLPENALVHLAEADQTIGDTESADGPDTMSRVQIRSIRVRDLRDMVVMNNLSDIYIQHISFPKP